MLVPRCAEYVIVDAVMDGGKPLGAIGAALHAAFKKSDGLSTKISEIPFRAPTDGGFSSLKCQTTCTRSLGIEATSLLIDFVKENENLGSSLFDAISKSQNPRFQPLKKAISCITDCKFAPTVNFTCNFMAYATNSVSSTVQLATELATTKSMSLKSSKDIHSSKLNEYLGKDLKKRCEAAGMPASTMERLENNLVIFSIVNDKLGALANGSITIADMISTIESNTGQYRNYRQEEQWRYEPNPATFE